MASFFALRLAAAARHIVIKKYRWLALSSGAFIMAGGIWSMHFVGMLAFEMSHPMAYDPWSSALSFLPAVIASYIVLHSLSTEVASVSVTLRNGIIVGAGIGTMHYVGLAASREIRRLSENLPRTRVPIVALTASVLVEDRLEAKLAGMDGFANKPVEMGQLTREIARVLQLDPEVYNASLNEGDDLAAQLPQVAPDKIKKMIVNALNAMDEFDFKAAAGFIQSAIDALQS
ncbi:MHYT domain-containing protein [Vibrio navarrensis]|uniref:MHYT domain-containing protein n=1 Tax=Vibrio navarrensis TaxID=29495 RepID=UPI00051D0AB3|nr:MHYT domain-containing protein [Vibrio navarrensis]KGK13864.1 hypothetical protein EA24_14340 [Vibrio navarrensis]